MTDKPTRTEMPPWGWGRKFSADELVICQRLEEQITDIHRAELQLRNQTIGSTMIE